MHCEDSRMKNEGDTYELPILQSTSPSTSHCNAENGDILTIHFQTIAEFFTLLQAAMTTAEHNIHDNQYDGKNYF